MESQKKNRDDLALARAESLRKAAEACGEASRNIAEMAMSASEEEFNAAIVNAAKNLSESLSALHACLNDTREFIKNNKGD
jgi:hypothetical protein